MTVQTGINNISNEWFKPTIDKKVLKNLSKRSDYEGWKHILIFFSCLLSLGIASVASWGTIFVIFCYYLFTKHVFGVHIHHVGDNSVSAEQMGINVNAVKIKAFMFVGFGAALGGIFTTLITYTFFPTQGFGYLLLALAAVFVGGTPYWGGLGTIVGAVFGVGIIAYMEIGIVAIGWSGTWRQFFNGLIILLALLGHRLHGERVR